MKIFRNLLPIILLLVTAVLPCCTILDDADLAASGTSGSITRFAVHGGFMYALDMNRLQTYSLSDPDNPQLVNSLAVGEGLETITEYEGTLYIGATSGIYIIGLADPDAPNVLGQSIRDLVFQGCDPVTVRGNYAYSTVKTIANICGQISTANLLYTYDISNKTNPTVVSTRPLTAPNGLGTKDDYLLVCDEGSDKIEIFSLIDPAQPTLLPYELTVTDPVDLIVRAEKLIVSTKTSFHFYDVSDMAFIRHLGSVQK